VDEVAGFDADASLLTKDQAPADRKGDKVGAGEGAG
jgi:hypothetical protein